MPTCCRPQRSLPMKYVGMQTQISRNNTLSILLLLLFPCIILGMVWLILAGINYFSNGYYDAAGEYHPQLHLDDVMYVFVELLPWVVGIVAVWFVIAYFFNASMIRHAVRAQPLSRKDNPRVYNIVENLCMACNMDMPAIYIVDDDQLNAFASGINKRTYAVTVTSGLLRVLDDDELAGVLAHELTHIRNRDTRLLITCIVFVGIVSTVMALAARSIYYYVISGGSYSRSRSKDSNNGAAAMFLVLVVVAVCAAVAYFFTLITRFAISRKREYMADAGGAELCGNPLALASALRKIAANPGLDDVNREDVAQLFIMHPDQMDLGLLGMIEGMFKTHPDPEKRIAILEQF